VSEQVFEFDIKTETINCPLLVGDNASFNSLAIILKTPLEVI